MLNWIIWLTDMTLLGATSPKSDDIEGVLRISQSFRMLSWVIRHVSPIL